MGTPLDLRARGAGAAAPPATGDGGEVATPAPAGRMLRLTLEEAPRQDLRSETSPPPANPPRRAAQAAQEPNLANPTIRRAPRGPPAPTPKPCTAGHAKDA